MSKHDLLGPIAALLEAQGLTVANLAEFTRNSEDAPSARPTIREFTAEALKSLSKNSQRSYQTHFDHLNLGIARQCECTCPACVQEFARAGTCTCTCASCAGARSFPAQGDVVITTSAIASIDFELMVELVQIMAVKRARGENIVRARQGLSTKPTHGQGAREMCVTALRRLKTRMLEKRLIEPDTEKGPQKGKRGRPKRRALTDQELAEVFSAVASGGDDPVLDLALTWSEFELAARRGGIMSLSIGELDRRSQMIGLLEKGNRYDEQPCSLELIDFLMALAASRAGGICVPGSALYDPNAPVFYFKDSTPERPHPVTSRRFDTLHRRVQLTLPWANSMSYSGHALRHTIGTIVERQAGFEVAKRMLRHDDSSTTDTYVKAGPIEVAKAISQITGRPHPLARDD